MKTLVVALAVSGAFRSDDDRVCEDSRAVRIVDCSALAIAALILTSETL